MTKIALLVGVSDYGTGLSSLPGVLKNVTALQQVLQQPEIGGFTQVRTLLNPDPQTMAEALETLFAERQKDDLVLLYFAGRGLQDDYGRLYLTSSRSRKNQQEKLVKSSAIPAAFVQEVMNESRAQHQLLILDCCWSSTLSADDSWWVDVSGQLQGAGRVILTATTSTSCYFQDNTSGLSVYTRYLVEGLATGAADLNQDGAILVAELHDYSQRKVQAVTPLMQPLMYGTDEQQVIVAQAAIDHPLFQYRLAAESHVEDGEFSLVGRSVLDVLRESLEIGAEAAAAIEAQVLQPGREYQIKLQRYVQELVAMCASASLGEVVHRHCQQQQRLLGLRESDVAVLTEQIAGQLNLLQAQPSVSSSPAIDTESTSAKGNASNTTHPHPVLADKNSRLLLVGGIAVAVLTLMGVISGLDQLPASQQLETINALAQARNYEECIAAAKTISKSSSSYADAQMLLNQCEAGVNWQNAQVQTLGSHSDSVWSVAFSANGQTLASGSSDNTINLWQTSSGELLHTLFGHSNTVWSVAFSANGQTLASGSSDNTIKIWQTSSGKLLHTLSGHLDAVRAVAFSADGQTLASGSSDNTIKIWQTSSGELLHTLSGHSGTVKTIAFSANGQQIASGSSDHTIKIWQASTGELLRTLSGHTDRVLSIALSSDGRTLTSGSVDRTVKIWNLSSGKMLSTLSENLYWVNSVAISPAGRVFASGLSGSIKIWDVNTMELLHSIPGYSGDITSITFSPDGNRLAFGTQDKTIKISWR